MDAGHLPLNRLALQATTHCLTGCAIGEVAGMVIASALAWGAFAAIVLSVTPSVLWFATTANSVGDSPMATPRPLSA